MAGVCMAKGTGSGGDGRSHLSVVGTCTDAWGIVPCTGHGGPFARPTSLETGRTSCACVCNRVLITSSGVMRNDVDTEPAMDASARSVNVMRLRPGRTPGAAEALLSVMKRAHDETPQVGGRRPLDDTRRP